MTGYSLFSAFSSLVSCATCMGDSGSPQMQAAGTAILFMLAVLAVVFGGMVAVVVKVMRRARSSGEGERV
jgi:heme/copper-type cytochrome/quinol oxidase subunit 2